MSAATTNAAFPTRVEQYYCPACDGAIAAHHVVNSYPKPTAANPETARVTRVFCPHCDAVYERAFVLRGGEYQPTSDVTRVTDPKTLAGIRRRVARVENTQLAQSA